MIGGGHSSLQNVCWTMDLPSPVSQASYDGDRKSLQTTLEARRNKRRERIEQQEADERAEGAVNSAGAH